MALDTKTHRVFLVPQPLARRPPVGPRRRAYVPGYVHTACGRAVS